VNVHVPETLKSLTDRARAMKANRRLRDAIALYEQCVEHYPDNAVAEHNLSAALGDAGHHADAERHARRALAKGLDAPETWLVLARALQPMQRLDDAQRAYLEVLRRRPTLVDAHHELVQLIWMRTGDVVAATQWLDRAIAKRPGDPALRLAKAKALEYAGNPAAGYRVLLGVLEHLPAERPLLVQAAHLAVMIGEPSAAIEHARRALATAPDDAPALEALAFACLAAGEAATAAEAGNRLRRMHPHDQHAIALLATAWRLLGDARYQSLYDYTTFVRAYPIDVPAGWRNLTHYLHDLANGLKALHPYATHPFGQSVRHGSQRSDVTTADDPALRALPEALAGPVAAHVAHLGRGDDPLRARNTGRWRIDGIWSVWLQPRGFHADHVHPSGWLSSACYVELPPAVHGNGQAGWIKFGEPGMPTLPRLTAEHYVKPEQGRVVLFPSFGYGRG
jgi:tetratricopeptide (TPR) repeat protein